MVDLENVNIFASALGLGEWVRIDNTNADKYADTPGAKIFAEPDTLVDMCADKPVYMFVTPGESDCAVCVTTTNNDGTNITGIMGRESGRTLEPMYAPIVLSFVHNETHMEDFMNGLKIKLLRGETISPKDKLVLQSVYPQFTEVAKETLAAQQATTTTKDDARSTAFGEFAAATVGGMAGGKATAKDAKPEPQKEKQPEEKPEPETKNDDSGTEKFKKEIAEKNKRMEQLSAEIPTLFALLNLKDVTLNVSTVKLVLECMENEIPNIDACLNNETIARINEVLANDKSIKIGKFTKARLAKLHTKDAPETKLASKVNPAKIPKPKKIITEVTKND